MSYTEKKKLSSIQKDVLVNIIGQNGDCVGISCRECPLDNPESKFCGFNDAINKAKELIAADAEIEAEKKEKPKTTKLWTCDEDLLDAAPNDLCLDQILRLQLWIAELKSQALEREKTNQMVTTELAQVVCELSALRAKVAAYERLIAECPDCEQCLNQRGER